MTEQGTYNKNATKLSGASNSPKVAPDPSLSAMYESALLGFILTDPDMMLEVSEILPSKDYFTVPYNRDAYALFLRLFNENRFPGAPALMINELVASREAGLFTSSDEASRYVSTLLDASSTDKVKFNPRAFREYAEEIKWRHESARLALFGRELAVNAPTISCNDREEYVDQIENDLANITLSTHGSDGLKHISQITGDFAKDIEMLHNGEKLEAGVPTGLDELDKVLNGLKGGEVCVLAARPGFGKTALSLQIALNVANMPAEHGKKNAVLIFSLEMMNDQLTQRLVANVGRINMTEFMRDYTHYVDDHFYRKTYGQAFEELMKEKLDEQYDRTQIALEYIKTLPIYPTTESSLTPNAIKSMVMKKKHELDMSGEKLGLIVIDYLQLVQPALSKHNANRTEEVGDISRKMKMLAKDFDVPVLLLAQLNRNASEEEKPSLKDLRESGSIEQDADKVLFIWSANAMQKPSDYPEYEDDKAKAEACDKDKMKVTISVAKNRQGESRDCNVIFDKGFQTFISQSGEYSDAEKFDDFFEKYYQKTRLEDIFWPLRQGEIPEEYEAHRVPRVQESLYLDPSTKTVLNLSSAAKKNRGNKATVRNTSYSATTNNNYKHDVYDRTVPSDMPSVPMIDETDYTSGFESIDDEIIDYSDIQSDVNDESPTEIHNESLNSKNVASDDYDDIVLDDDDDDIEMDDLELLDSIKSRLE